MIIKRGKHGGDSILASSLSLYLRVFQIILMVSVKYKRQGKKEREKEEREREF